MAAAYRQHAAHESEELAPAHLGIDAWGGPFRFADSEELENQRQAFLQSFVEQHQRARDLAARVDVAVAVGNAEIRAHELQNAEQRYRLAVRDAVRFEDGGSPGTAALAELVCKSALTDAGVADDRDDPALALECARSCRVERPRLLFASDEAREATRPGYLEARVHLSHSPELVDPHGLPQAPDVDRAEVDQAKVLPHEPCRVLCEVDAIGRRDLFDARSEADRPSLRG